MIRSTRAWTAALATAGLLALPAVSQAQSGSMAQSSSQSDQASKSPSYYLDQARQALDRIDETTLSGGTASTVRDLKQNFEQLRTAYNNGMGADSGSGSSTSGTSGSSGSAGSSGTSGTSGTSGMGTWGSSASGSDWRQSFSKIEQSLDQLSVPKSSAWVPMTGTSASSSSSGTSASGSSSGSGSTGTSGTAGSSGTSGSGTSGSGSGYGSASSSSSPSIDPTVMAQLKDFRLNIEQFYKAAAAGGDQR